VDWSLGHYEHSAYQLLPAAEVVVERAMPVAGERVVDVGCGTGNAALLAAARGARVTGVDPARRLLEVAREQAAARGLEVMFLPGEAAALPLPEASADVVLSVFGVIFAPNAQAATAELARVTAAGGRIVLSAWIPIGAISETNRLARETVMRALGAPAARRRFPGTTTTRSPTSSPRTGSPSASTSTASPSPRRRQATTSTRNTRVTRSQWPAAPSSSREAKLKPCAHGPSRSSRRRTRIRRASA